MGFHAFASPSTDCNKLYGPAISSGLVPIPSGNLAVMKINVYF